METQIKLDGISNELLINLFGKLDENIQKIEKAFNTTIVVRNGEIHISGEPTSVTGAQTVIRSLLSSVEKGEAISAQKVNYVISTAIEDASGESLREMEKLTGDNICLTVSGKPIKPKTLGQKKYIDMLKKHTVVFGVGPAGTGKTYLAMAMAITAFKRNEVSRIILTRPAIEAGEKLGFLPGDLQQKVDPYLRPLYDALHEIMGAETFQKNMEKGLIEVAPLAYMRGRTLDNSYIVLDEAQNTTPEQMKMFLTRIGFASKAIITGDLTQIDLPEGKKSGLVEAVDILKEIEDIGICRLTAKDVVRHPLVQKIIHAYEKFEDRKQYEEKRDTFKRGKAGRLRGIVKKPQRD